MIACQAVSRSAPPRSLPTTEQDTLPSLFTEPTLPSLSWEAHQALLTIDIRSSERATSQRDSVVSRLLVRVKPKLSVSSNYHAHFYTATPETPFQIDSTVFIFTAIGQFLDPVLPVNCTEKRNEFSPTYARFLVPRYSLVWPVSDTLRYASCLRTVPTDLVMVFTWQRPIFRMNIWTQHLAYSGTIVADSTRSLPLWIRGELSGTAVVWLNTVRLAVDTAHVSMHVLLRGQSSAREPQIIQQLLILKISRDGFNR